MSSVDIPQAIAAVEAALAAEREEQEAWSKSPFTGAFDWVVVRDKLIDEIRNHAPALLAEIERLRAENAELRENGKLVCEALRRAKSYER